MNAITAMATTEAAAPKTGETAFASGRLEPA